MGKVITEQIELESTRVMREPALRIFASVW
jgi:hypothetical protein